MPYLLTEEGVIVEDLDGVSWTDVIKQQRALAASAARYAELDSIELEEERVEAVETSLTSTQGANQSSSELVRIEIGKENEALTAALMERMEAMDLRAGETQQALVAALHAIGTRESVVNVAAAPAPNVTVEAAAPAEVQVDVHVPEQPAPNVTVHPEITLPASETKSKSITFVRDFSGRVEGAEITEE